MAQVQSDPTGEAILHRAQEGADEARQRCEEATEHLRIGDYVAALGAMVALDERVRYVSSMLIVLRDIQPALDQSRIEFNQNGGELT